MSTNITFEHLDPAANGWDYPVVAINKKNMQIRVRSNSKDVYLADDYPTILFEFEVTIAGTPWTLHIKSPSDILYHLCHDIIACPSLTNISALLDLLLDHPDPSVSSRATIFMQA